MLKAGVLENIQVVAYTLRFIVEKRIMRAEPLPQMVGGMPVARGDGHQLAIAYHKRRREPRKLLKLFAVFGHKKPRINTTRIGSCLLCSVESRAQRFRRSGNT